MVNSKFKIRLLALLLYCVVSAGLLTLKITSLELHPSPVNHQQPQQPQQQQQSQRAPGNKKLLRQSEDVPAADVAEVELSGFRLTQLPPEVANGSQSQLLNFFNLTVRQRQDLPLDLRFTFRLDGGARPCRLNERIFVAVMSTPEACQRRDAIRQTWATLAAGAGARVAFFFAGDVRGGRNWTEPVLKKLTAESERHGDLVLVPNFEETYRHLTLKVLAALEFACRMCPSARMFAKVDDDSMLNLNALRSLWLDKFERRFPGLQYALGHRYEMAFVERIGRWGVSQSEYPLSQYPSYMFGGAYVLRVNTCRMVDAARYFSPIPPVEDAFITGILPATLGIRQVADNFGFANQLFRNVGKLNVTEFRLSLAMSGTDLTPQYMLNFWRQYTAMMVD